MNFSKGSNNWNRKDRFMKERGQTIDNYRIRYMNSLIIVFFVTVFGQKSPTKNNYRKIREDCLRFIFVWWIVSQLSTLWVMFRLKSKKLSTDLLESFGIPIVTHHIVPIETFQKNIQLSPSDSLPKMMILMNPLVENHLKSTANESLIYNLSKTQAINLTSRWSSRSLKHSRFSTSAFRFVRIKLDVMFLFVHVPCEVF